jgi:MFS family permease
MLIACVIGIIGTSINLIEYMLCLIFGRIILGVACGFLTVSAPRLLEEYVPPHLYSTCAPFFVAA